MGIRYKYEMSKPDLKCLENFSRNLFFKRIKKETYNKKIIINKVLVVNRDKLVLMIPGFIKPTINKGNEDK